MSWTRRVSGELKDRRRIGLLARKYLVTCAKFHALIVTSQIRTTKRIGAVA
jgi:hypothetical protein